MLISIDAEKASDEIQCSFIKKKKKKAILRKQALRNIPQHVTGHI